MSDPFIGEVRMFGGNFAPSQWALCNGQSLPIAQYQALFSLLGTTFGGDGIQTFAVPDLQCRLPIGQGQGPGLSNHIIGEKSGSEGVSLTSMNMPLHTHALQAATANDSTATIGNTVLPGNVTVAPLHMYVANTGSPAPTFGNLTPATVGVSGGGQPHTNLMPSVCVSFIISLYGIYPSRN
jgi:microcystin-dependent protein